MPDAITGTQHDLCDSCPSLMYCTAYCPAALEQQTGFDLLTKLAYDYELEAQLETPACSD